MNSHNYLIINCGSFWTAAIEELTDEQVNVFKNISRTLNNGHLNEDHIDTPEIRIYAISSVEEILCTEDCDCSPLYALYNGNLVKIKYNYKKMRCLL